MKPISIAGGGLAGLTLGIILRRHNVPVTLLEAGHYPRHRVCGEFISGRGIGILDDLGLLDSLRRDGIREAQRAIFFSRHSAGRPQTLPQSALCISRFRLDACLAGEFQQRGGELREGCRWTGSFGEGCVRATGRRVESESGGWRWFGLKAHATNVPSAEDLEMYLLPHGYVGLTRLDDTVVNICGLFRSRETLPDLRAQWQEWLRGPKDSLLRHRMQAAEFSDGTFCAVAGISISSRANGENGATGECVTGECRLGDSLGMIAPLTGNGMSLAVESAASAAAPLSEYSAGVISWEDAQNQIVRRSQAEFGKRLRFAAWLQRLGFAPRASDWTVWGISRSPALWRLCYALTH